MRRLSSSGIAPGPACLTATLVNAVPPFEQELFRQRNDVATACLEADEQLAPPIVLDQELQADDFILWWVHDCVGISTHPCDGDSNIKVLSKSGSTFLDFESVIVRVPDPASLQLRFTETMEHFKSKRNNWTMTAHGSLRFPDWAVGMPRVRWWYLFLHMRNPSMGRRMVTPTSHSPMQTGLWKTGYEQISVR